MKKTYILSPRQNENKKTRLIMHRNDIKSKKEIRWHEGQK